MCHLLGKAFLGHNLYPLASYLWLKITTSPTAWVPIRMLVADYSLLWCYILDYILHPHPEWLGVSKTDDMLWRQKACYVFFWYLPQTTGSKCFKQNISILCFFWYIFTFSNIHTGIFFKLFTSIYFSLNPFVVQKNYYMLIWNCGHWLTSFRENVQRNSRAL